MLAKILHRRFERRLARAVKVGAVTAQEADQLRAAADQALAEADPFAILEFILMLIELLMNFFNKTQATA